MRKTSLQSSFFHTSRNICGKVPALLSLACHFHQSPTYFFQTPPPQASHESLRYFPSSADIAHCQSQDILQYTPCLFPLHYKLPHNFYPYNIDCPAPKVPHCNAHHPRQSPQKYELHPLHVPLLPCTHSTRYKYSPNLHE